MLPVAPPHYSSWRDMLSPIVRGESGWRPFSLAKGIKANPKPENLGTFTVGLKRAVKRWQVNHELTPDGIAGPATQAHVLLLAAKAADEKAGLPGGTSYGFVVYEGGGILAATNWQVAGGVDCGSAQFRIVGPPFSAAKLRMAFDPHAALGEAAGLLASRRDEYVERTRDKPWTFSRKKALRVAVFAHNWPAGAEQIVQRGSLVNPDAPADWTFNPETERPYTRAEWYTVYTDRVLSFSLGA